MTEELDQQAIDSAILLENRIRERVREEAGYAIRSTVETEVRRLFSEHKGAMLMEITTSINQMLKNFVAEERKPLWESTPEEFGLSKEDFKPHGLQPDKTGESKEIDNAVRKQS